MRSHRGRKIPKMRSKVRSAFSEKSTGNGLGLPAESPAAPGRYYYLPYYYYVVQ